MHLASLVKLLATFNRSFNASLGGTCQPIRESNLFCRSKSETTLMATLLDQFIYSYYKAMKEAFHADLRVNKIATN
jgi:hypothetical protein